MNYEELYKNVFTGGDRVIGFVGMSEMREFDRDHDVRRHIIREYPTSYVIRDSDVMSMIGGYVDFGYKIELIESAISILRTMNVGKRDIMFNFPVTDAPLVLTIDPASSSIVGAEWGIMICSCDVEPEESA